MSELAVASINERAEESRTTEVNGQHERAVDFMSGLS
jgi:hypothetical protein